MMRLLEKKTFSPLWPILLISVVATVVLYCDHTSKSVFNIVPDSTEYALAAHRFATAGDYKILVEGRWLPPRYPPWFSILALTPAYLLLGPEPGNAIYPIILFGVAGIVIIFLLGKKIGGEWGGAAAAIAVLALPLYRTGSQQVMADVPAAVLLFGLCLLYLRLRANPDGRPIIYFFAGLLTAVAALFRPVCLAAVLPFLIFLFTSRHLAMALRKLVFLAAPIGIAVAASLAYNAFEFGSPFRNGYHFWVSVPLDYRHLTFSLSYVAINFEVLWKAGGILLIYAAVVTWAINRLVVRSEANRHPHAIRWIVEFVLMGTGPIVLFHLIYFFPEPRFYLPMMALVTAMIGGIVGGWLRRLPRSTLLWGLFTLALLCTYLKYSSEPRPPSYLRLITNDILQNTPEDAWIISVINPAYLEYLVAKDSRRRIVPISRNVEYANKVITPERIPHPNPPPRNWKDHRCTGLLNGGAHEAVLFVASEQFDSIASQLARGTRIYVDRIISLTDDRPIFNKLKKRFLLVPSSHFLSELQLK